MFLKCNKNGIVAIDMERLGRHPDIGHAGSIYHITKIHPFKTYIIRLKQKCKVCGIHPRLNIHKGKNTIVSPDIKPPFIHLNPL